MVNILKVIIVSVAANQKGNATTLYNPAIPNAVIKMPVKGAANNGLNIFSRKGNITNPPNNENSPRKKETHKNSNKNIVICCINIIPF